MWYDGHSSGGLLMSQSRRNGEKPTQDFTDEEITRRMNEALPRALTSAPKPHKDMKIGKRKAKASAKAVRRQESI
jgi:hypothetical protein